MIHDDTPGSLDHIGCVAPEISDTHWVEYWMLPSGYVKIAIENGPVEIVDFPIKNGDFP